MQPSANADLAGAYALITGEIQRVKDTLKNQLSTSDASINQLLQYIGSSTGKMIRPALVLLSGRCFGAISPTHIRIAAVVEMIHVAALLHDDVLDQAQSRRGRKTVNKLWSNESAVLLGDFLLSRVFCMCAELDQPRISNTLAETTVQICRGELRQSLNKGNWNLTEPQYIDIIADKSGAFFSTCCRLGALAAEASEKELESLAEFGLNAGTAFQITDDMLDIIGNEAKTGKTPGSDFNKSKLTLPVIHFLATAGQNEKDALLMNLISNEPDMSVLSALLTETGSLDYVRSRAEEFYARAVKSLAHLKQCPARDALAQTASFMVARAF